MTHDPTAGNGPDFIDGLFLVFTSCAEEPPSRYGLLKAVNRFRSNHGQVKVSRTAGHRRVQALIEQACLCEEAEEERYGRLCKPVSLSSKGESQLLLFKSALQTLLPLLDRAV